MGHITFVPEKITSAAEPGTHMLDVAQESGMSIPFGCQNGICGTCIIKIGKGKEFLKAPESKELNTLELFGASDNHRLACQCILEKDGDVEIEEP